MVYNMAERPCEGWIGEGVRNPSENFCPMVAIGQEIWVKRRWGFVGKG